MMKKHLIPLAALSVLGMANVASAAGNNQDRCAPEPPATCYPDDCTRCYCLGPENYGVNAPVCPVTCAGDFSIEVAGFYWNAHQDGMEYGVDNCVANQTAAATSPTTLTTAIQEFNNLVSAEYLNPSFKWDFGFKVGLTYCSPCDGWDIGVLWTWYQGKASSHDEAEPSDNHTLLPLWSAFASAQGSLLYATDIKSDWKLELNLVDIDLGRNFWTSRYLAIRPHVGIRVAFIKQRYELEHRGGSWTPPPPAASTPTQPDPLNNEVKLENDYKAAGLRAGLDSTWNFGCGWALYGNLAAAILYGRFDIDHDEYNRISVSQHDRFKVLETEESFHASRANLDLALGVQWSSLICDCKYGLTFALGWEHHMFFDMNQMWRVYRIGDTFVSTGIPGERNDTGENVFHQRRGDLDTQGWTLTFKFDF